MKIDPNLGPIENLQSGGVQNTENKRANYSSQDQADFGGSDGSDSVQFSQAFADVQRLTSQLGLTPDVRSQRVAQLQQSISQGTYNPSNEDIANALASDLSTPGRS